MWDDQMQKIRREEVRRSRTEGFKMLRHTERFGEKRLAEKRAKFGCLWLGVVIKIRSAKW